MNEIRDFQSANSRHPVVETTLCVQFAPLAGFRAYHIGPFFFDCLAPVGDWQVGPDLEPTGHEIEKLDDLKLEQTADLEQVDATMLRAAFRTTDTRRTLFFQADKLVFQCIRNHNISLSFEQIRSEFSEIFGRFVAFCSKMGLGEVVPDFWEVAYLNVIQKGPLWETPSDWYRVLPGLFPNSGPQVIDHEWATFEGKWYLKMPGQAGRIHIRASKAVANPTKEVVLLLAIKARGPLEGGVPDAWKAGIDNGHKSILQTFYTLSSQQAKDLWEIKP